MYKSEIETVTEEMRQRMDVDYIFQTCRRLESMINSLAIQVNDIQRELIKIRKENEDA